MEYEKSNGFKPEFGTGAAEKIHRIAVESGETRYIKYLPILGDVSTPVYRTRVLERGMKI